MTFMCLIMSCSKVFKIWKETDQKITYCYNEARDNAKYIQAMEKCCHSLYLHDPVVSLLYYVELKKLFSSEALQIA